MTDQKQTPLVDAVVHYAEKHTARFHVPGHKGRGDGLLSPLFPYDVTELSGLDDLHHPEGAIRHAQQLAAEAFGADETFFLAGGSTAGNLAMIMAAVRPEGVILVQRNVHKSVINGLILAQARPVYLMPVTDEATGLAVGVEAEALRKTLNRHPEASAVFLSNPNYYGMGLDLQPHVQICREAGVPLLVDEAHGAHFGLAECLPGSAIQAGASAAVQSAHKTLPTLTMSSMLHVKGNALDLDRLRRVLAMIQSSSPSYLLLASLDQARKTAACEGKETLAAAAQEGLQVRRRIAGLGLPWLRVVEKGGRYDYLDPLKITLRVEAEEYSGFELLRDLEEQGIYAELADANHVLLVLSSHTVPEDTERLLHALQSLSRCRGNRKAARFSFQETQTQLQGADWSYPEMVLTPYEAFNSKVEEVDFHLAEGRICGEMVVPYPPGIPLVCPGERLGRETMEQIQQLQKAGCHFQGMKDSSLASLQVIKDTF